MFHEAVRGLATMVTPDVENSSKINDLLCVCFQVDWSA